MAWRLARSLEVLRDEIRAAHPGTTVWTIGDAAHRASASDHNPNGAGAVCAIDVLPDGGCDLNALAEHLVTRPHPALKYVIWNRRIASRSSGWKWRPYTGPNPHTGHLHASVGVGPDGRSTGPYDDTSPWGLSESGGMDDMFCKRGNEGPAVEALQRLLAELGFDPGPIDAVYGGKVEGALSAARAAAGNKVTDGSAYTPAAWLTLQVLLAKKYAGKDGAPGQPGKIDDEQVVGAIVRRLTTTAKS